MSVQHLLEAYSQGIFPWYEKGYPVLWWSPDPRLLLVPDQFKLSRSLKQSLKRPHQLKIDHDFIGVVQFCASISDRLNKTWITDEMMSAYYQLHLLGYAHSFEIWIDDQLMGGLYGISLGHAFFGESMFHKAKDTSKIAMYYLCQLLKLWNFDFIDCQLPTTHLQSLGARPTSRKQFLQGLKQALIHPTRQELWTKYADLLP